MNKRLFFSLTLLFVSVLAYAEVPLVDVTGDIRSKYQMYWLEKDDYKFLRSELNVNPKFTNEIGWAEAKVKFCIRNSQSEPTGTLVQLDKLMIGTESEIDPVTRVHFSFGRNKLENMFHSKVQYDSSFNGLHVGFQRGCIDIHGGAHIINSKNDKFGFIGETSMRNIGGIPVNAIYNFSLWSDDAAISQVCGEYEWLIANHPIILYAAFLKNHKQSDQDTGFYIGSKIGAIEKAGDMMIDLNYQDTGSKCIPTFDFAGIGKGIQLKAEYALTNQLIGTGKFCCNDDDMRHVEIGMVYKW